MSTALRPSGVKPPAHPFVNAQSYDARYEQQLADLLGNAKSVEEFITVLEKEGFEVSAR